jgi:hypothetical protein
MFRSRAVRREVAGVGRGGAGKEEEGRKRVGRRIGELRLLWYGSTGRNLAGCQRGCWGD